MDVKRCPRCGEVRPRSEFGRNRTLPDGLSYYCLACNRRRSQEAYRRKRARRGMTVRDHSWVPEGFRWCPRCRQAVAHADYVRARNTASGFGSECKACHNEASAESYHRRRYGLTRAQVALMRESQGDVCAICGDASPQHLDHDHATGAVRQLLCQRCNQGLGLFRDEPHLLRAAAEYVERHRGEQRRRRPSPATRRPPTVSGRVGHPPVGSGWRVVRVASSPRETYVERAVAACRAVFREAAREADG